MFRRRLALTVAAIAVSGVAASVGAQGLPRSSQQGGTLVDRLDEFGRSLIDGVFPPARKTQVQSPRSHSTTNKAGATRFPEESTSQRSGSAMQAEPKYDEPAGILSGPLGAFQNPGSQPSRATTPAGSTNSANPQLTKSVPSGTPTGSASVVSESPVVSPSASPGDSAGSNEPAPSGTPRLHERLRHFGAPTFPAGQTPKSAEKGGSASMPSGQSPGVAQGVAAEPSSTPGAEAPALAQRGLLGRRLVSQPAAAKAAPTQASDPAPKAADAAARPTLAKPEQEESERATATESATESVTKSAPESDQGQSDTDSPAQSRSVLVRPDSDRQEAGEADAALPASSPSDTTAPRELEAGPDLAREENLLFARQSPVLSVETMGPRRITVGKESTYAVTIRNSGQVAAEQVVVTVALPDWAEVLGTEVSKGGTASPEASGPGAGLRWDVGRVGAGEAEKLALRIIPRQSQPFDLAVRWDFTPAASQAMIEVQEPKLEMRLEGPREVLFGQSEVYRLELANSGTGDAENVEITLMPIGTGQNVPATHNLGMIKAGKTKTIEVELTARQTGTLTIRVDALGDGGVAAHLAHEVAVFRPALAIDVQAPSLQYVGTDAICLIRVGNPGTAPAKNVALTATIPAGAEYVSCTAEGQLAPDQRTVTWSLDNIEVGAEATVQLTCKLDRAGLSRLEVTSSAAGGLSASRDATIRVEAIADLELDVTDPAGPIPVDAEATYQVRIRNRGTKSAEQVEVVAYFSQGVEPTAAEGGRHQTSAGQVVFDRIPALAAGQEITFRIKAKAETAGNHICRVEVYCKPLGTRLVSEETTYFYGGPGATSEGPVSQSAEGDSPATELPIRTAEQRPTPAPPRNE